MRSLLKPLSGHLSTVRMTVLDRLGRVPDPQGQVFSTTVQDTDLGPIPVTGILNRPTVSAGLVVLLHGLGGSPESPQLRATVGRVLERGWSCLRLASRGADRRGADLYHAGLTADLHAALSSPALQMHRRVALLGFSMGGHLALRAASEALDERVQAVAAISPPVDLAAAQRVIDSARAVVYRRHVLRGLKEIYAAVAQGKDGLNPTDPVMRVRRLRDFDARAVVPRFGFKGTNDYYQKMSLGPVAASIDRPTLVLASAYDPMIPTAAVRRGLSAASRSVQLCVVDAGGHVAFPSLSQTFDAGSRARKVHWLDAVLDWLIPIA